MLKILNRMAWFVSGAIPLSVIMSSDITIGFPPVIIFSVWLVLTILVKMVFFSKKFLKNNIKRYDRNLLKQNLEIIYKATRDGALDESKKQRLNMSKEIFDNFAKEIDMISPEVKNIDTISSNPTDDVKVDIVEIVDKKPKPTKAKKEYRLDRIFLLLTSFLLVGSGIGVGVYIYLYEFTNHLPLLVGTVVIYLLIYETYIKNHISRDISYLFNLFFVAYIIACSYILTSGESINLDIFLSISISSILVLLYTSYESIKTKTGLYYSIGVIGAIFSGVFFIDISSIFINYIIWYLVVFFAIAIVTPIFTMDSQTNFINTIIGYLFALIYISWYTYIIGITYMGEVNLGLAILGISLAYLIGGIHLLGREKPDKNISYLIISYLGIGAILTNISIEFIFNMIFVIPLVWILQSLFASYLYLKIKNKLLLILSIVMMVGVVSRYLTQIYDIFGVDLGYIYMILAYLILIISFSILYIFKNLRNYYTLMFRLFHIIILIFTLYIGYLLIGDIGVGNHIFIGLIVLSISLFYYLYIGDIELSAISKMLIYGVFLVHLYFINTIDININLFILIFGTSIIGLLYLVYRKIYEVFYIISFTYFIIASSIVLYMITGDYFSLTIYWSILVLLLIHIGAFIDRGAFRILGIYLGFITLFKIVLFDLGNSINSLTLKVFTVILVLVTLYYLKQFYDKNNLDISSDIDLNNLIGSPGRNKKRKKPRNNKNIQTKKEDIRKVKPKRQKIGFKDKIKYGNIDKQVEKSSIKVGYNDKINMIQIGEISKPLNIGSNDEVAYKKDIKVGFNDNVAMTQLEDKKLKVGFSDKVIINKDSYKYLEKVDIQGGYREIINTPKTSFIDKIDLFLDSYSDENKNSNLALDEEDAKYLLGDDLDIKSILESDWEDRK